MLTIFEERGRVRPDQHSPFVLIGQRGRLLCLIVCETFALTLLMERFQASERLL
jgi:hypothetical protein